MYLFIIWIVSDFQEVIMQINIGIIRRCEQSFLRERLSTCQLKPVDSVVLIGFRPPRPV